MLLTPTKREREIMTQAYFTRVKTWDAAVAIAAAKARYNGAFYQDGSTWVVTWDAKAKGAAA